MLEMTEKGICWSSRRSRRESYGRVGRKVVVMCDVTAGRWTLLSQFHFFHILLPVWDRLKQLRIELSQ